MEVKTIPLADMKPAPYNPRQMSEKAMAGLACLGMEIDPLYCDMGIRRRQNFTGQEAKLEGGGLFAETEAGRLKVEAD